MSELTAMPPTPKLPRESSADKIIIAHVERWMALIRQIRREESRD